MVSKLKYEYLLFFIGLIWILFFSFVLQLTPVFSKIGDDITYLAAAKKLYLNLGLSDDRPMVISIIQGLPFLFGFSESVVLKWGFFLNFSCWFITILLVFKIISSKLNRRKSFLFALLFMFCIGNLAIAFNFLSESIFIFFLVIAIYFINNYYLTQKFSSITISISVLLFAILIKPISIGLIFIIILLFIKNLKKIFWNKFVFLVPIAVALILIQMFSLKKEYGDYTISYIGSVTYYNYLGAKADCLKKEINYLPGENERTDYFSKLSSHEQRKIANEDIKDQIKNNTLNLFKAYVFCIYSNISKGSYIVSECKNEKGTFYFDAFRFLFKAISKLQNILITSFGVLLSFYCLINYKKEVVFNIIISMIILYLFFMSAMSCYQTDRFHIVIYPLIIILFSKFGNKIKI